MIKNVFYALLLAMCMGCATGLPVSHKNLVLEEITFDDAHSYFYFYRPCVLAAAGRGLTVFENDGKADRKLGGLNCHSYFIYQTDPGEHRFYAHDALRTEEILTIDAEPGKKYFVEADMGFGWIDVKPMLTWIPTGNEELINKLQRVPGY